MTVGESAHTRTPRHEALFTKAETGGRKLTANYLSLPGMTVLPWTVSQHEIHGSGGRERRDAGRREPA